MGSRIELQRTANGRQTSVQRLLVQVRDDDVDTRSGCDLSNAAAHLTRADDAYSLDFRHCCPTSLLDAWNPPLTTVTGRGR